jgi:sterol desaturase/sphingolipid hydroxylase (fatty acid hydroxylase superfamily)
MNITTHTSRWMLIAPALLVLAATMEAVWLTRRTGTYDWKSFFASGGDLLLRLAVGMLPLGLAAGLLYQVWEWRVYTMPMHELWPWVLLLVGQDFFYYWMHRADHRVRWLWATHSVHHSPQTLNLSAAYRLGWTARLSVAPIFFAPLVLIGFPPAAVGAVLAANLFYQFWLHATWLPRLGPLEWILNTPAHHRVHHGANVEYLDANFGGVLIVFDRWFGTFVAERPDITIRYGVAGMPNSNNPIVIGLREWLSIIRDVGRARSLRAALAAAFGPPRTHPADAASGRCNNLFQAAHRK